MEIKICGLTKEEEADYLNAVDVHYAGFVFFEKSKRNISIEKAKAVMEKLRPDIKKVAVTVSPDTRLVKEIEAAGFDVLQVHKELKKEVLEDVGIPVWYAFNVANPDEMKEKRTFIEKLPKELSDKIKAIVVDGAEYGSGKTFDWKNSKIKMENESVFKNRSFVLAGGLRPENVAEGIRIFTPDIVDVSSGVEGTNGKDKEKIEAFVKKSLSKE